ncbi:MAG: C45 family autoproteolytic acyltransferase/hydrolase [bacterium]|nr:C45 family autoproteolytic acyltransferase/hydrolase [bacterium]
MKRPPLRVMDASGSAEEIGAAHGRAHAAEIQAYTADRVGIVASGVWTGAPLPAADVVDIAHSMIPAHESFDGDLHAEMVAMAEAAGVSPAEAIVVGGFTDFVDAVRAAAANAPSPAASEDDCTAVLVPDGRADGAGFLAQTWDMHASATDHVLLLRVRPDGAPAARLFTTAGCLGQIGINSEGLCVGVNNLTGADGRPGVAWPSVVRAMLKCSTAPEALEVLLGADLAGAHNYLILDRQGTGFNVEAMPSARPVTALGHDPLVHTNHTLDAAAEAFQAERDPRLMRSSRARLAAAADLLAAGRIDAERLFALTREPTAICVTATPPFHIESSGAAVMRPRTGDFWACWGHPTENDFQHIEACDG